MSDCRLPYLVSSNPDNLMRDQMCLQTICEAAAFSHCPAPLSQVRIQPQSRLLSGRRKKALFVSPSPDTASKRAKGIYETPKKFRVEKTGEISRNLPFSRFSSSGSKLTCHHGWDSWTRTSEMQESKSCALPTWLYPNIFLVIFYHTKKTMSIQKSRRSGIFVFEIISALIFRRELYSPFCQA